MRAESELGVKGDTQDLRVFVMRDERAVNEHLGVVLVLVCVRREESH